MHQQDIGGYLLMGPNAEEYSRDIAGLCRDSLIRRGYALPSVPLAQAVGLRADATSLQRQKAQDEIGDSIEHHRFTQGRAGQELLKRIRDCATGRG